MLVMFLQKFMKSQLEKEGYLKREKHNYSWSQLYIEESLKAADLLNEVGINAEIIDPITLSPLDYNLIKILLKNQKTSCSR